MLDAIVKVAEALATVITASASLLTAIVAYLLYKHKSNDSKSDDE